MIAATITWVIAVFLFLFTYSGIRNKILLGLFSLFFTIAILSLTFILSLYVKLDFQILTLVLNILALTLIGLMLVKIWRDKKFLITRIEFSISPAVIIIGLLFYSLTFFRLVHRWGEWDSWAIWCLHAKFLLDPEFFTNLFSQKISWTHPDYPLLLPASIAMFWKSLKSVAPLVPLFFAYVSGFSIPLLIYSSLKELKQEKTGLFILMTLCCTAALFPFASSQYADTFLAAFFLLSFVLARHSLDGNKTLIFLTGFFSACGCLIKNEGIPFLLIFVLLYCLKNRKDLRRLKFYFIGTIIPLIFLLIHKLFYAPPNDVVSDNHGAAKLMEYIRYETIIDYFAIYLSSSAYFLIAVWLFALVFARHYFRTFEAGVLFLLVLCYFLIYLITPNDLTWHLESSFDRLMHQVFPAFLYTITTAFLFNASTKISQSVPN